MVSSNMFSYVLETFGWDIGTNLKFLESRLVSSNMFSYISPSPSGSYAPVSPSRLPANRLTYYSVLRFSASFYLFFSILRFDHGVIPNGLPKRAFPHVAAFWGSADEVRRILFLFLRFCGPGGSDPVSVFR